MGFSNLDTSTLILRRTAAQCFQFLHARTWATLILITGCTMAIFAYFCMAQDAQMAETMKQMRVEISRIRPMPGTTFVGSSEYQGHDWGYVSTGFATSRSEDDVRSYYDAALARNGWQLECKRKFDAGGHGFYWWYQIWRKNGLEAGLDYNSGRWAGGDAQYLSSDGLEISVGESRCTQ